MDRARRAAFAAVFLVMAFGLVLAAGPGRPDSLASRPAAAAVWGVSTLVLSELQTGGVSASDEFVELANAGTSAVDLAGLEVVYVTATGSTVTRKAAWSGATLLEPGRHLLLANSLGVHAPIADALYSGGLAATGGALVLRQIGGSPVDAVGWGDATNAFVEGSAAAAPAAGSSLERRPGGLDGNGIDTNENASDFFVQASPSPQGLAAPPVGATSSPSPTANASSPAPTAPAPSTLPAPTASPVPATASPLPPTFSPSPDGSIEPTPAPSEPVQPTPSASASPSTPPSSSIEPSLSPSPIPSATPSPTSAPSVEPSTSPSLSPSPSATPSPSSAPSIEPSLSPSTSPNPSPIPSTTPSPSSAPSIEPSLSPSTSPNPSPIPSTTPSPSSDPSPTPSPRAIGDARTLPLGSRVTVEGILTTPLGVLEDGRSAFIQDATGGIAVYLDAAAGQTPAGTTLRLTGVLDERYAATTLRASLTDLTTLDAALLPDPIAVATGLVGEGLEGRRVLVGGRTSGSATAFADGTGLLVDDGSGAVRVIVTPDALAGRDLPSGSTLIASGPVGQRDSSGSGATGYRIYVTLPADLAIVSSQPDPSPSPSVAPSPAATSTPGPTGSPTSSPTATAPPTATPIATATPPGPELVTIAAARSRPIGAVVRVGGVVTAEAGRLGTPALLAIQDATAAIVLRLDDTAPAPARGSLLDVTGKLADPYGQLELRVDAVRVLGSGPLPEPLPLLAPAIGESTEGRLVTIDGTVPAPPSKSSSHDIAFDLVDVGGGRVRVMADASSGLTTSSIAAGRTYRLVGIVGQRASRKGALDGYRVWLRDARDLAIGAAPAGTPSATGVAAAAIASVAGKIDIVVAIEGMVTAPATLLDASGRRVVLQDSTAAIEVLLPVGSSAPRVGSWLRAEGVIGRAYGAPRLRATAVAAIGSRGSIDVPLLDHAPGETLEWRLVMLGGRITSVTRLGSRWRAELESSGGAVVIDGLPGAGIPSTRLVNGRHVVVTGLVRRPYPGATDQRFTLVPRGPQDITDQGGAAAAEARNATPAGGGDNLGAGATLGAVAAEPVPDIDLATLGEHPGERVRVGGLVRQPLPSGFSLDDGTAVASVRLAGPAAAYLGLLIAGDAANAIGLVVADEASPGGWLVEVTASTGLIRVGDLGQPVALTPPGSEKLPPPSEPSPSAAPVGHLELASLPARTETAGLLTIVVASALTLTWPLLRQLRARRRATERVARRLASIREAASGQASNRPDAA